jgi:hypothetical protein
VLNIFMTEGACCYAFQHLTVPFVRTVVTVKISLVVSFVLFGYVMKCL